MPVITNILLKNVKLNAVITIAINMAILVITLYLYYFFLSKNAKAINVWKIKGSLFFPSGGTSYLFSLSKTGLYFWLMINIVSLISTFTYCYVENSQRLFLGLISFSQAILLIFFATNDIVVFYAAFEMILVPMFLMIGMWGSKDKLYASLKLFIYTLLGSILFLVALIIILLKTETSSISLIINKRELIGSDMGWLLWLCLMMAFAIKIPMFPVHSWLPLVHVEAPTAGSILLAAVVIKMGAFGIMKLILPLFPELCVLYAKYVIILSVIAIIYGSILAYYQTDIKRVIAYSSIAHMGYVTIGLFTNHMDGYYGAVFQMISHGFISTGLFLCIGILYHRTHTRSIFDYGGLAKTMPKYSLFFTILVMANIGLPGLSGFVGEFFTLSSLLRQSISWGIVAASGVLLSAIYMLKMNRETVFGIPNKLTASLGDLKRWEMLSLFILSFIIVFLGIYPKFINNI